MPIPSGRTASARVQRPLPTLVRTGLAAALAACVAVAGAGPLNAAPAAGRAKGSVAGALLLATKALTPATQMPGTPITYTLNLSNQGQGTQGDNPGDELIDVLPPLLVLNSASLSGSGTLAVFLGTNTVTWNGSLTPGASVVITVHATIVPNAADGQQVSNQGVLAFDADGNGTNETAGLTDWSFVPGAADPTVFTVQGPDMFFLPTLSAAGLAALAASLAGLGILLLRRRGPAS